MSKWKLFLGDVKKMLFYIVLGIFGCILYITIIDGITNARYQSVVVDKIGVEFVIEECIPVADPGVRLCYAKYLGDEKDVDGYAVRLTKEKLINKREMTLKEFRGGE